MPRTELLSYTAYGTPWIYPPFGGALLYLVYAVGGLAALSWVNALACVLVTGIAMGRPRLLTSALAIFAVPSIAFRTVPRAELFTMLFFTAFLALLCQHRREGRAPLWLLPVMMLVWVNAHSGFSAGLALLAAYVALELTEFCFKPRRLGAGLRLKRATPWVALSLVVTTVNPWGVGVYRALLAHNKLADLQGGMVGEWAAMRLTAASLAGALQLRDPNSGYWWLLLFAGIAAATALYRRQFAEALLLVGAAYLSVEHLRFQGLFAVVVIVISGEIFSRSPFPFSKLRIRPAFAAAATATLLVATLALVHIADTVTSRSYLADGEFSSFGTGLSWWYPQRAAQFIESNALPAQLFNDYNSGGYLTLRLGLNYRDFADGRGIPFPVDVLMQQAALQQSSPDSDEWAKAADRYGINTIIVSIARVGGLEYVPLRQYCSSAQWKPVYLDDVSLVLVRNLPRNQQWTERFAIDCANYRIVPPSAGSLPENQLSARQRVEMYNFYANTASIYYVLGRDNDATGAVAQAEKVFADDPGMPMLAGQLLQANGKLAEAEAQYRDALRIRPTEMGWFLLARALLAQKNYPEAASALQQSADLAVSPTGRY
ncbi:MAG TPA: tetratricopeptide repeat protein, partial [Terracidiphilus sp.]